MKNQYVGDIGDYRKYALLRAFAEAGIKVGINWYLTEDDASNDGKFTNYLQDEAFRRYSPEVFDALGKIADNQDKTIKDIEGSGIVPGALFYSDVLNTVGTPSDREQERMAWFQESINELTDAELIYMDPDNGLQEDNEPGKLGAEKYVLPDEVEQYYRAGQNVVYYCHKGRRKLWDWHNHKSVMCKILPDAKYLVLTYHKGTQRSYIFLIHPEDFQKDTSNYRYSDRIELKIEVENMTDKDIKGVQGTLKVSDMFGAEIMTSNCDFTGKTIPAKQKVTFDELGLDVNQYMDNHTKFYNTDYDDLQFEYTITNVVFADGSAKDTGAEEETSLTASEVDIVVTDKTNLEENYRAGRYSPRVEFTFAVTNNTDKDIRGIQGSLTIMDLFGKEITTIGCDFTGETFAAGETKTISGLGIDINQYIDSDTKLYNEDFSDLQFKYEVTQIVYK